MLFSNLIAMLFQALSARLGIVTGHNLASSAILPRPLVWAMWVVSRLRDCHRPCQFLGAIGLAQQHAADAGHGGLRPPVTYLLLSFERGGFRPWN